MDRVPVKGPVLAKDLAMGKVRVTAMGRALVVVVVVVVEVAVEA